MRILPWSKLSWRPLADLDCRKPHLFCNRPIAIFGAGQPAIGHQEITTGTNSHAATRPTQNTKMDTPTTAAEPAQGRSQSSIDQAINGRRRRHPSGRAHQQNAEHIVERSHHLHEHLEDAGCGSLRDSAMESKQTASTPTVHAGHSMQQLLGHDRHWCQDAAEFMKVTRKGECNYKTSCNIFEPKWLINQQRVPASTIPASNSRNYQQRVPAVSTSCEYPRIPYQ